MRDGPDVSTRPVPAWVVEQCADPWWGPPNRCPRRATVFVALHTYCDEHGAGALARELKAAQGAT